MTVLQLGALAVELFFQAKSEFCAFYNTNIDDNKQNHVNCCEKQVISFMQQEHRPKSPCY